MATATYEKTNGRTAWLDRTRVMLQPVAYADGMPAVRMGQ